MGVRFAVWGALWAALLFAAPVRAGDAVRVTVQPERVWIEQGELQQLNFDFVITNRTGKKLTLRAVEMDVRDRSGALVLRRDVDGSGASPGILTVRPDREVEPNAMGLVYNPFTTFPLSVDLSRIDYRLRFEVEGRDEPVVEDVTVRPQAWAPRTPLVLPLTGRAWAKHGHDFLAHHRRWNPLHPLAQGFGATRIFARYAVDLMVVDEAGRTRKGQTKTNGDFFGWGAELRAPGDGVVAAARDDEPDDDIATGKGAFDPERLPRDPMHFYGNYLLIDHGHGEFSMLGHLMRGSLRVKPGERVRRGQPVARLGASGSAEFEPHLHYELRTGPGMAVDGLPAYFTRFERLRGAKVVPVKAGPIDSGEFVRAD